MSWWKTARMAMDAMKFDPVHLIGEVDRVERLTTSEAAVSKDLVGLGEHDVVRGWLRELVPGCDQQVHVHREWGTVSVVPDDESVGLFWTDGSSSWVAGPPGAAGELLTLQQIERIIVEATTSSGPPQWPDWDALWGPAAWGEGCRPRWRSVR